MEAEEISVEEAQKIIASHEQLKHAKDKKARKDAPKPEEVRSAVAAVVLAENQNVKVPAMRAWDEEAPLVARLVKLRDTAAPLD